MKKVTPLYIEIALHYVCRTDEFPRLNAPACMEACQHLRAADLLADGNNPQDLDRRRRFEPTEGLYLWMDRMCAVPFPTKGWV